MVVGYYVFIAMFWCAVWSVLGGVMTERKGYGMMGGMILGLFLGPIAALLTYLRRPDQRQIERNLIKSGMCKKCLRCAELVRSDASACRFCGRSFEYSMAVPTTWQPYAPSSTDDRLRGNSLTLAETIA